MRYWRIDLFHRCFVLDRDFFDTGDIDIKEAFHFLQDKVEPVGDLRHAFQRNLMEGILGFSRGCRIEEKRIIRFD